MPLAYYWFFLLNTAIYALVGLQLRYYGDRWQGILQAEPL